MNERRKGPGPPPRELAVTGKESTGGEQRGGRRCAATSPGRPNPVGPRRAGQPVNDQRWAAATTCAHATPANCARPPWRERLDCPHVARGPGWQLPGREGGPAVPRSTPRAAACRPNARSGDTAARSSARADGRPSTPARSTATPDTPAVGRRDRLGLQISTP